MKCRSLSLSLFLSLPVRGSVCDIVSLAHSITESGVLEGIHKVKKTSNGRERQREVALWVSYQRGRSLDSQTPPLPEVAVTVPTDSLCKWKKMEWKKCVRIKRSTIHHFRERMSWFSHTDSEITVNQTESHALVYSNDVVTALSVNLFAHSFLHSKDVQYSGCVQIIWF